MKVQGNMSVHMLHQLIEEKQLNKQNLSELIGQGIDLNKVVQYHSKISSQYYYQTPLSFACRIDAPAEIICLLLDHGADVTARRSNEDRTPLLWACEYSTDIQVLELLIARGANVNDTYEASHRNDHSALAILCIEDRPSDFVELLINNGADPNYTTYDTPIAYCFGYADYAMDYQTKTKFNNTIKIAEILIMAGASTDIITLRMAQQAYAPEKVITFLLTEYGKQATPSDLYDFCKYAVPSINLIDLFIDKGASQADFRHVVGLLCYQKNSYNAIQYILNLMPDPSYWNIIFPVSSFYGYEGTILHYACLNNRHDLITLFLSSGVDPKILDNGCQYQLVSSGILPACPSQYELLLIKAGKLVTMTNDGSKGYSNSNATYKISAADTRGNIIEQEWIYRENMGDENLLRAAKIFASQHNQFLGPAPASIKQAYL